MEQIRILLLWRVFDFEMKLILKIHLGDVIYGKLICEFI